MLIYHYLMTLSYGIKSLKSVTIFKPEIPNGFGESHFKNSKLTFLAVIDSDSSFNIMIACKD